MEEEDEDGKKKKSKNQPSTSQLKSTQMEDTEGEEPRRLPCLIFISILRWIFRVLGVEEGGGADKGKIKKGGKD